MWKEDKNYVLFIIFWVRGRRRGVWIIQKRRVSCCESRWFLQCWTLHCSEKIGLGTIFHCLACLWYSYLCMFFFLVDLFKSISFWEISWILFDLDHIFVDPWFRFCELFWSLVFVEELIKWVVFFLLRLHLFLWLMIVVV